MDNFVWNWYWFYKKDNHWMVDYVNPMFKVILNEPAGYIQNKWWVDTREWDTHTLDERIHKHFKNTSKKYQEHD